MRETSASESPQPLAAPFHFSTMQPAVRQDELEEVKTMARAEIQEFAVTTMPETTVTVGSEGDISIRQNGGVIRVLTAEQAMDLAKVLNVAADRSGFVIDALRAWREGR